MSFCTNYVYFISSQMGSVINCIGDNPDPVAYPDWTTYCADSKIVKEEVNLWLWFLPSLLVIFSPLVFVRDMEKLAWSHLLADFIILTVVAGVFTFSGIKIHNQGGFRISELSLATNVFFKAIPYSAFAFEGVAVVLPLREIVEDKDNFFKIVCVVVSGICIFYIFFAEWTNWVYGKKDYELITDVLPAQNAATYTLKAMYTVNLFFSYPMQLSPAVNLIESYIFNAKDAPTKKRYWMQNLVRTGIVLFTIALAILIYPKISLFIEVLAASTCSPLAFTLPAFFHWKLVKKHWTSLAIVICTCALTVFMIVSAVIELIKSFGEEEE